MEDYTNLENIEKKLENKKNTPINDFKRSIKIYLIYIVFLTNIYSSLSSVSHDLHVILDSLNSIGSDHVYSEDYYLYNFEDGVISFGSYRDFFDGEEHYGILIKDTTKRLDYNDISSYGEMNCLRLVINAKTKHKGIKELLRNSSYNKATIILQFDKWVSAEIQQEYLDIISGLNCINCLEIQTNKLNDLNFRNLSISNLILLDDTSSSSLYYDIELNENVSKLDLFSRYPKEDNIHVTLNNITINSNNANLSINYEILCVSRFYENCIQAEINDKTQILVPENTKLSIIGLDISNITENAHILYDFRNLFSVLIRRNRDEYYSFYYIKDLDDYDEVIDKMFGDEEKQRHLSYY